MPSGTSLSDRIVRGFVLVGGCFTGDGSREVDEVVDAAGSAFAGERGGDTVFPMLDVAAVPGWPRCTVRTSPFTRPREATVAFWSDEVSSIRGGCPVRTGHEASRQSALACFLLQSSQLPINRGANVAYFVALLEL